MRVTELRDAFAKLVTKLNALHSRSGDLSGLSTTDKSSLVAAINEVLGVAQAAGGGGVSIDDAVTNAVNAWSSTKIDTEITNRIGAALEGEDLSDLAAAIAALQAADLGLVSADAAQSLSGVQQSQARTNIDAASATDMGSATYDFEAEIDGLLSF